MMRISYKLFLILVLLGSSLSISCASRQGYSDIEENLVNNLDRDEYVRLETGSSIVYVHKQNLDEFKKNENELIMKKNNNGLYFAYSTPRYRTPASVDSSYFSKHPLIGTTIKEDTLAILID